MKSTDLCRLAGIAIVTLCAACAKLTPIYSTEDMARLRPGAAPVSAPDPRTQMAALESRIEQLIEQKRLEINPNANPLVIDAQLVDVARKRSVDMATKKYLANASPEGDTSATILMAQDEKFQGLLGENIAAQYYVPSGGVDVETYAQRFVTTWLESPRHRENLSFKDYDRTGVGAAVNDNTVYVTQLFSTTLGMGQTGASPAP